MLRLFTTEGSSLYSGPLLPLIMSFTMFDDVIALAKYTSPDVRIYE